MQKHILLSMCLLIEIKEKNHQIMKPILSFLEMGVSSFFNHTNKYKYSLLGIKFKYHIKFMCPLMAQVWQKHLYIKISHYTKQRVINDMTREALVTNILNQDVSYAKQFYDTVTLKQCILIISYDNNNFYLYNFTVIIPVYDDSF